MVPTPLFSSPKKNKPGLTGKDTYKNGNERLGAAARNDPASACVRPERFIALAAPRPDGVPCEAHDGGVSAKRHGSTPPPRFDGDRRSTAYIIQFLDQMAVCALIVSKRIIRDGAPQTHQTESYLNGM